MGAPASVADGRPSIEETGDPGSELRMAFGALKRRLYARRSAAPVITRRTARSSRPTVHPTRTRSTRELSRSMADRLAPAHRRASWLARAAVRPRHRRLGIPVERLGEVAYPSAG